MRAGVLRALAAALAVALTALLLPAPSAAHDLRPGALALREVEQGRWAVRVTPGTSGATTITPTPVFPEPCTFDGAFAQCGTHRPTPVLLTGLDTARVAFGVSVTPLHGETLRHVLAPGDALVPDLLASASTPDALTWLRIGAEHVVFGPDHVLFVLLIGWVAATGRRSRRVRAVAGAVTGFTIGHSITLAATALGALALPPVAVELLIAASIVLLAHEVATRRRGDPSWTLRAPGAVAAAIGLAHGCGFGGALLGLGLPTENRVSALLLFNVGVEVAQLGVVLLAAGLAWLATRALPVRTVEIGLVYVAGVPAAAWTIERAIAFVG